MNKASICTPIKTKILTENISKYFSREAGSKRIAKASSIAKHNTTKSKQIKNTALKLRGKSVKFFINKISDTIFNESMWDYVDVILRFEGIVML